MTIKDEAPAGSVRVPAAEFISPFALIVIGAGAAIALASSMIRPSRSRMVSRSWCLPRRSPTSAVPFQSREPRGARVGAIEDSYRVDRKYQIDDTTEQLDLVETGTRL